VPSDRAGVVGIKSSNSVISVRGAVPLACDRDEPGPMTRYAVDNAKVLDVVSALDSKDVWNFVQLSPGRARPSGYATKLAAGSLTGKTFGVLTNYLATQAAIDANTSAAGDINALFQQAKADLVAAGATVVDVTLPIKPGDTSTYIDIAYTGRRDSVPSSIAVGSEPKRVLYNPVTADLTGSMVPEAKAFPFQELIKAVATSPGDTEDQKLATVMRWINPVSTSSISQAMRDAILNKTTYGFNNPLAQQHFLAVRYQIADYETWLATAGPGGTPIDALIFPVATSKTIGTNPSAVGGSSSAPGRTLINSFSLPFVAVPMGVLPTGEPSDLGFLGNKYFADADLMAMVGAYEQATKKRIVSPLAPALAEEHIEYDPDAATAPVVDAVRPGISIRGGADVKGSGKKARVYFGGGAYDNKGVASVTVTVHGDRAEVKLTAKGWVASKSMSFVRQLVRKGVRSVKVVAIVRDSAGNATASTKTVKLPKEDALDI
jgi:amidase